MRGFVACWFFPPVTSSEGIVTYKLLRNSKNLYDVCGSNSTLWSFDAEFEVDADNINIISIDTNDPNEWVEECIKTFEKNNAIEPYDFIMTRSMPPEALKVGIEIKNKYGDIPWIASMGDPIANNPYEIQAYVYNRKKIPEKEKSVIRKHIAKGEKGDWYDKYKSKGIDRMLEGTDLERETFQKADLIVCPCTAQRDYTAQFYDSTDNFITIPHTYDKTMYSENPAKKDEEDKTVISFVGSSDKQRTLIPLVEAIKLLREQEKAAAFDSLLPSHSITDKILVKLAGNHPVDVLDAIVDFYVDECFEYLGSLSFFQSLKLMEESDWLLNVDAKIPEVFEDNTIYFAGKLADYMGAHKPIISITDKGSPADIITNNSGGISIYENDPEVIADTLRDIVLNKIKSNVSRPECEAYREQFDAVKVAEHFDGILNNLIQRKRIETPESFIRQRQRWYPANNAAETKLLTVCVPSYNVEQYLDRCLNSLVSHSMSGYLEIIVVNDGSKDRTMEIAKAYEQKYPEIIKIIDKENGGHGSTINAALEIATGKYFKVVDSDDWVNTPSFEKLIKLMRDEYPEVDVISTEYDMIDLETAKVTPWKIKGFDPEYDSVYKFSEERIQGCYFTMHSSFFRTEVLRKHHKKLQEHTFYVDVEYILFPVPYIETAIFSSLRIYRYCLGRDEQSVNKTNMVKRFDNHDRVVKRVIKYYDESQGTESQMAYMKWVIKETLVTHYKIMLQFDDDKSRGFERAKEFDAYLKTESPSLYKAINKNTVIRDARNVGFDCDKYERRRRIRNNVIVKKYLKQKKEKSKGLKHMNILIATENMLNGGLETQINTFVKASNDTNAFVLATAHFNSKWTGFVEVYDDFSFSESCTVGEFISDVNKLRSVIKKENIDVVMTHPFYSFFPAVFAAKAENIPVTYVYHGLISYNGYRSTTSSILFDMLIDYEVDTIFCVSENGKKTIEQLLFDKNKAVFLPNSINTDLFKKCDVCNNGNWALVTRLDYGKVELILRLIDELKEININKLIVYGEGNCKEEIESYVINRQLTDKVEFRGHSYQLFRELNGAVNGVIGIGRVAMESIAMGLPVMLVGYNKISGLMGQTEYDLIKKENFTNMFLGEKSTEDINDQLALLAKNPEAFIFSDDFQNEFSAIKIKDVCLRQLSCLKPSNMLNLKTFLDEMIKQVESTCGMYYSNDVYLFVRNHLIDSSRLNSQKDDFIAFDQGVSITNQLKEEIDSNNTKYEGLENRLNKANEKLKRANENIRAIRKDIKEIKKRTLTSKNIKRLVKNKLFQ